MNNFENPHISFSQINTYMMCPLKYRFIYVDEVDPDFTPSALPFGSAIHEALAYYYRHLKNNGTPTEVDDIIVVFRNDWSLRVECAGDVKFDGDDSKTTAEERGINMIRAFYDNVNPGEVLCVEQEFCLRKMDQSNSRQLPLPIVGKIDLIEKTSDGNIVVVDHKTASRKYNQSKAETDLQLTLYTAAFARSRLANGDKTFHARFDLITKTKNPEFISYPAVRIEEDHRRVIRIAREIIFAIDSGVFYPVTGWMCSSCQYKSECNRW